MSEITAICMPKWGLAMEEGMITEWLVEPGADIVAGQDLVEIETSKITNVLEAPATGTLRRIVAPAGSTLPIGALLGLIADAGVEDAALDRFEADFVAPEAIAGEAAADSATPTLLETRHGPLALVLAGPEAAPPVLLVHGFGGGADNWMFVQPLLAQRFRVAALDLPGHGASFKALPDGLATDRVIADAIGAAASHLGTPVHLVGHSLGGGAALAFAQSRPGAVASLTLLAPTGLGPEINADYLSGFLEASRRKEMKAVLGLLLRDPAAVSRDMVENVLRLKRMDGVQDSLVALADAAFDSGRQRQDLRPAIAALNIRRALVWGSADRILPASHAAGLPPEIQVTLLADAGHLPHLEEPSLVAEAIVSCIDA